MSNGITLEEATAQRPKIELRVDAALSTLLGLVKNLPGGSAAIAELKASILALEIQATLEIELIAHGRAPLPPIKEPRTLEDEL